MASKLAKMQPLLQPKTKALIKATMSLVQDPSIPDSPTGAARNAYATSLCGASNATVEDEDLAALCAGALMATTPWNYYNGTQSYGHDVLLPSLRIARTKLLKAGNGPGIPNAFAIHLLIHLEEPQNAPESYRWEALPYATKLFLTNHSELVPTQGHLTHMPAHLFLRTGDFSKGVETAQRSIANNKLYMSKCLTAYAYGHNLKMLVAHARFAGMSAAALKAAAECGTEDAGLEETPGNWTKQACVDCAGVGSPEKILTNLRFGLFKEILDIPPPSAWGAHQTYNQGAYYYARAMALFAIDKPDAAEEEAAIAVKAVKGDMTYGEIIPYELEAARAWYSKNKNVTAVILALERAVEANDALMYLEPPRWYYPPRQCLGEVLLAVDPKRALEVFREDQAVFPDNAWSLFGAAKAAAAIGEDSIAKEYKAKAASSWDKADVPLMSSCLQFATSPAAYR